MFVYCIWLLYLFSLKIRNSHLPKERPAHEFCVSLIFFVSFGRLCLVMFCCNLNTSSLHHDLLSGVFLFVFHKYFLLFSIEGLTFRTSGIKDQFKKINSHKIENFLSSFTLCLPSLPGFTPSRVLQIT